MTEGSTGGEARPRGRTVWAWGVIVVCTAVAAWSAFAAKQGVGAPEGDDRAGIRDVDIEGRVLVAKARAGPSADRIARLDALDGGRLLRRQRIIVLAAELATLDDARRRLDASAAYVAENDTRIVPPAAREIDVILRDLYAPIDPGAKPQAEVARRADALSESQRELLTQQLGWIGRLAAVPRLTSRGAEREAVLGEARRTVTLLMAAAGGVCCGAALGSLALIGLIAGLLTGRLKTHWSASAYPAGVLAEIFAAWLVVTTLPNLLVRVAPSLTIWASGAAFFIGFAALLIGAARGIPWSELRLAVGFHCGRGPLREAAAGVLGCFAALPIVFVGALGTAALTALAQQLGVSSDAAHPIVDILSGAGPLRFALMFVLAAFIAPVVEETFFRGILYRHLRTSSAGLGRVASVLGSGIATALVFAAVHPQSWIAIPALGALGFAFALIREWRGSLIAPIVAHGVWNGTIATLTWFAFS